jgi:hypothetical protein
VFQLQLTKRQDALPLTRDYTTEFEAGQRRSRDRRLAFLSPRLGYAHY